MAVACGGRHTLVLGERGRRVFACGSGERGQLGTGTRDDKLVPAPVAGLPAALAPSFIRKAATPHPQSVRIGGVNFGI